MSSRTYSNVSLYNKKTCEYPTDISSSVTHEHRIKRLCNPSNGTRIITHRKRRNERQPLQRIFLRRCGIHCPHQENLTIRQEMRMCSLTTLAKLHILRHPLQHTRRLIKENRKTDPRQILPYTMFQHTPETRRWSLVTPTSTGKYLRELGFFERTRANNRARKKTK